MQRLRLTFAKTAAMKYTGHLDTHLAWERTFRRAGLPLAYSGGFHPQPRIQLAAALPLGFTSDCEVADIWLETPHELEPVRAALQSALPPGLQLVALAEAPQDARPLQTLVRSAEYDIHLRTQAPPAALDAAIAGLLAQTTLPRMRREKAYDLRPLIEALEREGPDAAGQVVRAQLAAREGATGRPEEVVAALGADPAEARYHRRRLLFAA
jgi:radical SAM-linked protein